MRMSIDGKIMDIDNCERCGASKVVVKECVCAKQPIKYTVGEIIHRADENTPPSRFIVVDQAVDQIDKLYRKEFEKMIGKNEIVGLPVTQSQEQSNYNKKQRNEFREELHQKLTPPNQK